MHATKPRLPTRRLLPAAVAAASLTLGLAAAPALASSHREAPSITTTPKVDASDFYMFMSYEPARLSTFSTAPYVTLIANYEPLQDAYGGPNFYVLDPNALYEIHVDNNADAKEDITFQFKFKNTLASTTGAALTIGSGTAAKSVGIPLVQAGPSSGNTPTLNLTESFTVDIVRGDRRTGTHGTITAAAASGGVAAGASTFTKPVDNIGTKTIPDYATYAGQYVYSINIPGCTGTGKLFVGQRKDPFAVQLGVLFDLVHASAATLTDASAINASPDSLATKNVTTLAIEVPASCLRASGSSDTVIGGWTTASLRQGQLLSAAPKTGHQTSTLAGGAWTQVSRLGNPLVNEVVIGLGDKDKFNGSKPQNDATNFLNYVTNPTLPALLDIALGANISPTNIPRQDLVVTFLTGLTGINQPTTTGQVASEMLRLNTAITPVALGSQNRLGVVGNVLASGSDFAGFPNGRRPHDDVVDIALAVMGGALCQAKPALPAAIGTQLGAACAPSAVRLGDAAYRLNDTVDNANSTVVPLLSGFPYLNTPLPGAQ